MPTFLHQAEDWLQELCVKTRGKSEARKEPLGWVRGTVITFFLRPQKCHAVNLWHPTANHGNSCLAL